jgi:redox-sensitive bicupin YhaK (pirin superfamily)
MLNDSSQTTGWTIQKRPAAERGRAEHGWLHARFTFSFAEYFDRNHMGFRSLRVMNNDIIEPKGGFPTHPHKDAEIFTYVISGQLEHRDSMGNGSIITPGNLQYMSAGSGVRHSEFNPSEDSQTELYQIWLLPNQSGGTPLYAEKQLGGAAIEDGLTLLFSGGNKPGITHIRQDAEIFFGKLSAEKSLTVSADEQHPHAWLQLISGQVNLLGETLDKSDGLAISDHPDSFEVSATSDSKFLLFRLE